MERVKKDSESLTKWGDNLIPFIDWDQFAGNHKVAATTQVTFLKSMLTTNDRIRVNMLRHVILTMSLIQKAPSVKIQCLLESKKVETPVKKVEPVEKVVVVVEDSELVVDGSWSDAFGKIYEKCESFCDIFSMEASQFWLALKHYVCTSRPFRYVFKQTICLRTGERSCKIRWSNLASIMVPVAMTAAVVGVLVGLTQPEHLPGLLEPMDGKGRKRKYKGSGGGEENDRTIDEEIRHVDAMRARYEAAQQARELIYGSEQQAFKYSKGRKLLEPHGIKAVDEAKLNRAVVLSKQIKVQPTENDIKRFINDANVAFTLERQKVYCQGYSPTKVHSAVFKAYVNNKYCCTATQVGNRMYIVVHCLDVDVDAEYLFVNNVHTLGPYTAKELTIYNEQLAYFRISGIPSVFSARSLRVLEDAQIISLIGYGSGQEKEPVTRLGFASPAGWCNAASVNGDCTGPVLDKDGFIVGFWTHGAVAKELHFGRFEPVTQEMREDHAKVATAPLFSGLVFRSSPLQLAN